eukprot:gnl/MRDRNA2_/MRDRNA2_160884_c0_seq1.p1 gnl/MRDRNA2_/MRDRNA2_160884_c0~~gnl/MRDRNA2_/MRDRNA2_160884_c0_seq1.p1  ORF type:complete len:432 (+),score=66.09 gnl/MRDRNA2_/MRDRNA2_160884_c0_seq1:100-1395(+)
MPPQATCDNTEKRSGSHSPILSDGSRSRSNSPEPGKAPITAATCPELPLHKVLRKRSDQLSPEFASKIADLQTVYEKQAIKTGHSELSPAPPPEPKLDSSRPVSKGGQGGPAEPNFAGPIQGLNMDFQNMSFPIKPPTQEKSLRPASRGEAFKIGASEALQSNRSATHSTIATPRDLGHQPVTPPGEPRRRASEAHAETMPELPSRILARRASAEKDHFTKPRGKCRRFIPIIDTSQRTARRRELEREREENHKASSYHAIDEIKPPPALAVEQRRRNSSVGLKNNPLPDWSPPSDAFDSTYHVMKDYGTDALIDKGPANQGPISQSLLARRRSSEHTMMAVELSLEQREAQSMEAAVGLNANVRPQSMQAGATRRRSTGSVMNDIFGEDADHALGGIKQDLMGARRNSQGRRDSKGILPVEVSMLESVGM